MVPPPRGCHDHQSQPPPPTQRILANTTAIWIKASVEDWFECSHNSPAKSCKSWKAEFGWGESLAIAGTSRSQDAARTKN
eukprot:618470-Amphidinium_carterae.1